MANEEFLLRVKFREKLEWLKFSEDELQYDLFLAKGKKFYSYKYK